VRLPYTDAVGRPGLGVSVGGVSVEAMQGGMDMPLLEELMDNFMMLVAWYLQPSIDTLRYVSSASRARR
jgi:hypothetical protein